MRDSLSNHAHTMASDREREWDEDQVRWERQLRKLAGRRPAEERPAPVARLVHARTTLELIAEITNRDVLLLPRNLPVLKGNESEDLVCGQCGGTVGLRIARRTARRRHPEGDRLVVRCICGALNLLALDETSPV